MISYSQDKLLKILHLKGCGCCVNIPERNQTARQSENAENEMEQHKVALKHSRPVLVSRPIFFKGLELRVQTQEKKFVSGTRLLPFNDRICSPIIVSLHSARQSALLWCWLIAMTRQ